MSTSQAPPSSIAAYLDDCIFAIRKRVSLEPVVGVVLGSGLGAFAERLEGLVKIPYRDLPHMPASAVQGHAGNLCFGRVDGVPGVRCVLLTNAAGGLESTWAAGDLMVVTDHLNLTGTSPLLGPNDDALGRRFPDMSVAYDEGLRGALEAVAKHAGIELRRGIYAGLLGPSYETPAEVRMVRSLGAQAVGMSTVHEVIALRHMGVKVGALSCITNLAAGIAPGLLDHSEVEATARARQQQLETLLQGWIVSAGALAS